MLIGLWQVLQWGYTVFMVMWSKWSNAWSKWSKLWSKIMVKKIDMTGSFFYNIVKI